MFEFIGLILQAWREIAHISEWTGLSVGVLCGLGLVAYLDPGLRTLVIRGGIAIVIGYGILIYGNAVGRNDVRLEWHAANLKAVHDAQQRDADADKAAEAKYLPLIAAREKELAELQAKVTDYETKIGKLPPCPLGADALFLRGGPKAGTGDAPAPRRKSLIPPGLRAHLGARTAPAGDGNH